MTVIMMNSLLAVFSFAVVCHGAGIPRTDDNAGIMKLPLTRMSRTDMQTKRQVDTGLNNPEHGTIYIVSLEIGTPPQPMMVQIDTGSSDLWVDPDCTMAGSAHQVAFCQSFPIYDPYNSSTAIDTGYSMSLGYGKGSCSGEYLTDNVLLGGLTIINQEFGWATSSTSLPTGIMGIGPGVELIGYYNIIDQLALQGITNSRAFSLDIGNVDTAEGSIIFGGVDTMKYTGPLEKRPIIPPGSAPDGYDRYWIYMTSVGITKPGANTKIYTVSNYNQAVFLDSGGTLSRLPANLVAAMLSDFPGAVNQGNGLYTVDCSYATQAGTLEFGFGNTVIHVPFHEFIWVPSPGTCVFGATANAAGDVSWVLGDSFLRSAYVVYDQDNRNLLLANTANCGTNVVPIGSGVDAVPSITGACKASMTASSTATSGTLTAITSKTTSSTTTATSKTSTKSSSAFITKTTSSTSATTSTTTTNSITSTSTSTSTSTIKSTTSTIKSTTSTIKSTTSTIKSTTSISKSTTKPTTSTSTSMSTSSVSSTKASTTTKSTTLSSTTTKSPTTTPTSTTKSSSQPPSSTITTTTSHTTTTLTTSTTTTASGSTPTAFLSYTYLGCYHDSKPASVTKLFQASNMTIESCIEAAHGASPPYAYAALEYGKECWVATSSPAAATGTAGPKACTMTCAGDANEKCGGRGEFGLWASATATAKRSA